MVFFTAAVAYAEPATNDATAFTAQDTSAPTSGVLDTCTWEIDSDGVLVLALQPGLDIDVLEFERLSF